MTVVGTELRLVSFYAEANGMFPTGTSEQEGRNVRGHIRPRGKDTWVIVVDVGKDPATGKRKQKWLTVKGTKRDADRKLAELLNDLNKGSYVEPPKITVGQYLDRWLEDYARANTSQRTFERYAEIVRLHLKPALGGLQLSQLRPLHLQQYYTTALREGRKDGKPGGLSPRTVLHHHRVLHEALDQAVRWQLLARNPADAVEPPRPERHEMQVLTAEQVRLLLEAAQDTPWYVPVLLAVTTGMRRGEILGLRWSDVDLEAGVVSVRQTLQTSRELGLAFKEPKTDKSRRSLPVPAYVVEVLREHRKRQVEERLAAGPRYQDHGLVVSAPDGTPIHPDSFSKAFARIARKAGVPATRLHDSRHTHASLLLAQGVHPKIVSERLGHSGIGITLDTYSHLLPGLQEEAVRRLGDTLFGERQPVSWQRKAGR